MMMSPKLVLKTRSLMPLAARVWRIVSSCRWNSWLEGAEHESQRAGDPGGEEPGEQDRPEEPEEAHAGRLARDDLEVAGQAAAGEEHRDEERHRHGVGEELRQHEREELQDEVERDALGDDEIGQVVEAVDEEKEGEERDPERERRDQLAEDVAVEDRRQSHRHGSVVAEGAAPRPWCVGNCSGSEPDVGQRPEGLTTTRV